MEIGSIFAQFIGHLLLKVVRGRILGWTDPVQLCVLVDVCFLQGVWFGLFLFGFIYLVNAWFSRNT